MTGKLLSLQPGEAVVPQDRTVLGPADVSDAELAAMVADHFGAAAVELLQSSAAVMPYDFEAITTGGRYWVGGSALVDGEPRDFTFFVKVVHSFARSPLFQFVPDDVKEWAASSVPWRNEPTAYGSDLGDRLPNGLSMPRALAVRELDSESAVLWLERVDHLAPEWTLDRYAEAAYLMGRFAANPRVHELSRTTGTGQQRLRAYVEGRVRHNVLPVLRDEATWSHPLVAGRYDEVREPLLAHAAGLSEIVDELFALPVAAAHGDACSRNLLVPREGPGFVLIDYGFWGEASIGFDLSQLLLGEVFPGERPATDLPALEAACCPAYVEGLRAEGCDVPVEQVRRAHALAILLFSGISAPPIEHLYEQPTDELHRISAERAVAARWILDLVAETR
jgi:hypothetical protein